MHSLTYNTWEIRYEIDVEERSKGISYTPYYTEREEEEGVREREGGGDSSSSNL